MENCTPTTLSWIELKNSPFGDEYCARSPVVLNDDIILSPSNTNYLYLFNTKSQEWSKYDFPQFRYHSKCISKNRLYIFDGYGILLILDVATKKVIKQMKHSLKTGYCPAIMPDPENNDILHIIGGYDNNKHMTLNINTGNIKTIHTFHGVDGLEAPAIIHVHGENGWYLIHGQIATQFYDLHKKTWTNTNIKMPENNRVQCFGYIMTPNHKYILLFSGEHIQSGKASDDILVFDTEKKEYYVSMIKAPKCAFMNAALTKTRYIHLFGEEQHWKMDINAHYFLIYGYIKQCSIEIPVDILNQIIIFYGCDLFLRQNHV